jgi:hypothetical protein
VPDFYQTTPQIALAMGSTSAMSGDPTLRLGRNSLFRNILYASHCESIFYAHQTGYTFSKSLRMNILEKTVQKNVGDRCPAAFSRNIKSTPEFLRIDL